MKAFKPRWCSKFRGSPVRREIFAAARLRETKARQWKMVAGGSAAVVIVLAIMLNYGKLEHWASSIWSNIQPPLPAAPAPDRPPQSTDDGQEQRQEQEGERLIPVQITVTSGRLKDALPFDVEYIQNVSLRDEAADVTIRIPEERQYVVAQNLVWISLDATKADHATAEYSATFIIETREGVYSIPYSAAHNTIDLGGGQYYTDDMLLLLAKGLLEPDSKLAELDRVLEQARVEYSVDNSRKVDDSFLVEYDRLLVDGKDFNAWQTQLPLYSHVQGARFYDHATGELGTMGEYGGADNLIALSRQLLFASSQYKTTDGVSVGMTKQEVLARLGKPNVETETKWSYKPGDYSRFHLYFDAGVVKYMSLTMPV